MSAGVAGEIGAPAQELKKMPSLRRSLFWSLVMNWGGQAVGTGVAFVLAALLGPREFGTVSVALVFLTWTQFFLDVGVNDALVQRSTLDEQHLNSAFWLTIGLSIFLTALAILSSSWWASINHEPRVAFILCVLSLRIPINGLDLVQQAVAIRNLNFKVLAIRRNFAEMAGGVLGIGMAAAGFGIWALVGQQLGRDFVAFLLLWNLGNWRPRLRFSCGHLNDLRDFSMKTFLTTTGSFIHNHIETMLIGLFFGPVAVGTFRLADRIRTTGLLVMTQSLKTVSLTNLSKAQDDPQSMKRMFLSLIKASAICTIPIMAMVAACSGLIVRVLGSRWYPAAGAIAILSGVGAIQAMVQLTASLLQAKSRPGTAAKLSWSLAAGCVLVMVTVGTSLRGASVTQQVNGIALCKLGLLIGYLPLSVGIAMRASGMTIRDLGRVLCSAFAASLACFLGVKSVALILASQHIPAILSLAAAAAAGTCLGAAVLIVLEPGYRARILSWSLWQKAGFEIEQ